jgi:UDP-glucose 4-epimerase
VTGGAGFIGAHLCRRLTERGHEVTVLDDLSTGFRSNLDGMGATLHVGSVLDADLVSELVAAADAVVHLAAAISVPDSVADPVGTNEVNVTGTLNVLCAARDRAAHTVLASSSAVYGANPEVPTHEDLVPRPASPYAVSKLATESYGLSFAANYRLPVIAFRFFNVYGPLQSPAHAYAAVVPSFVSALLNGRPLQVFGDGRQSRDFTSVSSLVAVLADAVERRVTHDRPVNLAFGTSTTLLELIECLQRLTGLTATVEHREPRAGDVRISQADNSLLRSRFPQIAPQSLDDGLDETIAWFRTTNTAQS